MAIKRRREAIESPLKRGRLISTLLPSREGGCVPDVASTAQLSNKLYAGLGGGGGRGLREFSQLSCSSQTRTTVA